MLTIRRHVLVPIAAISLVALAHATPAVGASAAPISGLTRVSVDQAGGDANGTSTETSISGNGRYVAFTSAASDLVTGDTNGTTDVFRRDLQTGTTTLVSVAGNGGPANGASSQPSISQNGRWVAFTSLASNLFGTDTNGVNDVYIRDVTNGVTRRASVAGGRGQLDDPSGNADISADGNLVAFVVDAGPVDKLAVRDRHGHVTKFYDSGPAACPTDSDRFVKDPTLGANGRYLAFSAECVDTTFLNTTSRVLEVDRTTGTWTEVATMTNGDDVGSGFLGTRYSADANALAWTSEVVGHGDNNFRLFVHERTDRYLTPDTSQTLTEFERPDLSGDGRYLAYVGGHGIEPFGNPLGPDAVHVIDLASNSIVEASAPPGKTQRDAGLAHAPAIDDAGNVVAFTTNEALVAGDHNHNVLDVYATARASAPPTVVPTIIVNNFPVNERNAGQTQTTPSFAAGAHFSGPDAPITWHTVDGTAQAPGDYTAVTNGTASVPPNPIAGTAALPVTVRGDNTPEPDETFRIRVTAPPGFRVLYNPGNTTIVDDD